MHLWAKAKVELTHSPTNSLLTQPQRLSQQSTEQNTASVYLPPPQAPSSTVKKGPHEALQEAGQVRCAHTADRSQCMSALLSNHSLLPSGEGRTAWALLTPQFTLPTLQPPAQMVHL